MSTLLFWSWAPSLNLGRQGVFGDWVGKVCAYSAAWLASLHLDLLIMPGFTWGRKGAGEILFKSMHSHFSSFTLLLAHLQFLEMPRGPERHTELAWCLPSSRVLQQLVDLAEDQEASMWPPSAERNRLETSSLFCISSTGFSSATLCKITFSVPHPGSQYCLPEKGW